MPERTVSIFESILRVLWHVVEIYVFVVLIVKDHRIPNWNASKQFSRAAPAAAADARTPAGRVEHEVLHSV
ncbi:MAG: hypothetical protein JWQ64_1686 [Subtercola sp.]|nr:hypothetical protein [Subtercola sp.]